MTTVYGWTVGRLLRVSVVVLLAYGGLLVLTYWVFQSAPTGFIPQQDQGRLIVSIQLPDSASLERTEEAGQPGSAKIAAEDAGRGPHGRHLRHVVPAAGQQLQFRLDVHRPRSRSTSGRSRNCATRPSWPSCARQWAGEVKDAVVTVFGASPIPGLGVAGGFKFMVEDRGGLGLADLADTRPTTWSRKLEASCRA